MLYFAAFIFLTYNLYIYYWYFSILTDYIWFVMKYNLFIITDSRTGGKNGRRSRRIESRRRKFASQYQWRSTKDWSCQVSYYFYLLLLIYKLTLLKLKLSGSLFIYFFYCCNFTSQYQWRSTKDWSCQVYFLFYLLL